MSAFFVDTSALIKRYITEIGSPWVKGWITPRAGHQILIARLTTIEIISVLARRQRENSISVIQVTRARNNFNAHLRGQYSVLEFDQRIIDLSRQLLMKHPLRTLDAIQLASALYTKQSLKLPLTFISADKNLLTAASSEGFATDDPNAHP